MEFEFEVDPFHPKCAIGMGAFSYIIVDVRRGPRDQTTFAVEAIELIQIRRWACRHL